MKKSLKKILIVALIATSGVAAAGGQVEAAAAKPAPKPAPKVAPAPNPAEPAMMRASGIRW